MQLKTLTISAVLGLALATSAYAMPTTLSADDLSGLNRAQSDQFDEVYIRDGIDAAGLRVEAVDIGIESAQDRYALGFRDLEILRRDFERDLRANSTNGDAAVTLEVILTELVPNRSHSTLTLRSARYRRFVGTGRASMEAIYRNAETGEVLMVIVDEREGPSQFRDAHTVVPSDWHDARQILDQWAEELPLAL